MNTLPLRTRIASTASLFSAVCFWLMSAMPSFGLGIDLDLNGMDDIWEERFGAQALAPNVDTDGDGKTNLNEATAGTNPFDATDCLAVTTHSFASPFTSASLTFPTKQGKAYVVQIGGDLAGWNDQGDPIEGSGGDISVSLSSSADTDISGSAVAEYWTDINGSTIADLTGIANYPNSPNGSMALSKLELPTNSDANYGVRVRGYIKPPVSGSYVFAISSRNQSQLLLSTDANPANATQVATVTSSLILTPQTWDFQASQQSAPINLVAGNRYYVEVLFKHSAQEDHCAVAWDPPSGFPAGFHVVDSQYLCPFVATPSQATDLGTGNRKFIRVAVVDKDSDGDGLTDWSEHEVSGEDNFSAFDNNSTPLAGNDFTVASNALSNPSDPDVVEVIATDTTSYEDPRTNTQIVAGTPVANVARNVARFRIQRTGTMQPVTVNYTLGDGPASSDGALSGADYAQQDINGGALSGSITLSFGQVSAQVVILPALDALHEYPEEVQITLDNTVPDSLDEFESLDIGALSTAIVNIFDGQEVDANEILFVGRSSPEPGSVAPQGTAIVSGFLNGTKNHMRLNTLIMAGFSSAQNDSHIHKANAGPLPGGIVYEITEVPDDPGTDPKIGEILGYPWTIDDSAGGVTGSTVVHSLFSQNGQTPMYLNWHTNNNQSGELWAILAPEAGSIDPPDPPPAPPAISPLAGADLERDVRRFLDQATFGATDATVYDMINVRIPAAGGDRIAAYTAWIDEQIDTVPQSWLVDYVLACDNQERKLRGYYDPARWVAAPPQPIPKLPGTAGSVVDDWPSITRTFSNSGVGGGADMDLFPEAHWYPNQNFPINAQELGWARNENVWVHYDLQEVNHNNRRRGHWLLMVNGKDQLRQKMGFALQQIIVVADTLTTVRQRHIGAANYQDMMNYNAFRKFRDQINWVNWSPIMGKWLSSLKNQQAYDTSVPADGIPDVFPDENLAREDMQLFTIGLFNLWLDGTLVLDEGTGLPKPTYTNTDITEFARVLTGQSFSRYSDVGTQQERQRQWGITAGFDNGNPFDTDNSNGDTDTEDGDDGLLYNTTFSRADGNLYVGIQYNYPMRMFGPEHDPGVKTLAGGKVVNNTGTADLDTRGRNDLRSAMNWFGGNLATPGANFDDSNSHSAVPPFIALRLIQRLTSSNPSSAYLYRVAKAFKDSDGDLEVTLKAILLDYEVRELAQIETTSGIKRSPLEGYMQLLRNFSQRETAPGTFAPAGGYCGLPLTDASAPLGGAVAPPADGYLTNFGWPASQAANMTFNSHLRYPATDGNLTMTPFGQPTVFNYYLPAFRPGGPVADAGMVAPELQLATETAVIQNVNYVNTLVTGTGGQSTNTIGANPTTPGPTAYGPPPYTPGGQSPPAQYNQRLLYGATLLDAFNAQTSDAYDNVLIELVNWAENIISWAPVGTSVNSQAARDDILELIDAIDLRIMNGWFKARYPINAADNEDPFLDGVNPTLVTTGDGNFNNDGENKNPREIINDALFEMTYNPYSATATTAQNAKRDLFRYGLYLMAASPENWVRK